MAAYLPSFSMEVHELNDMTLGNERAAVVSQREDATRSYAANGRGQLVGFTQRGARRKNIPRLLRQDPCLNRSIHHMNLVGDAPFGDELFPLSLLGFHGVPLLFKRSRPHTRSPVNSPLFRLQWPAGGTGPRRSPLLLSVGCIHDLSPSVGVW